MKTTLLIVLAVFIFSVSGCNAGSNDDKQQNTEAAAITTSTKFEDTSSAIIAVAVAQKNYQQLEFEPVYETLISEGFNVIVISEQAGIAKSGNDSVNVDIAFSELSGIDIGGVVVIGGTGAVNIWDNTELLRIIKETYASGGVIAAICLAPLTLANADVIKSGDTASWYSNSDINKKMSEYGIIDSQKTVTVNGKVITANGPDAAKEFADEIVNVLKELY